MEEELNKLKEDIFCQAERYLSEMNEFVPFGSFYTNGKIAPVMCDYGVFDVMNGKVIVEDLKKFFIERLASGISSSGAIAYDVALTINDADGNPVKRDALCLITSIDGEIWTEDYYPYLVIDGLCIWQ